MPGRLLITAACLAAVIFSAEITPEKLLSLALDEIKSLPRFADKTVSLNFVKSPRAVAVSTDNYTIEAELSAKDLGPVFFVKYAIYTDGRFFRAFRLRCRAEAYADAYYARRTLRKGEPVTAEDFYPARTDILKHSRYLAEAGSLRGDIVLTAGLNAGDPLFVWMLGARRLVNAGDNVSLCVQGEGVVVRTTARSLQAGTLGDRIRVRLPNDRVLQVEITGEGECRMTL
ncbi:MAG: flagellar basal body P-ring formation chaperone FlgA [Candidatus Margulisbacteria bacterium]|jgi:flagella basal body P-ring formation protein FlgA|nr:flagellar basal body P-ring formation chaperone FlgA [Candidatus Margulisiibacteriota bacterium]